MATQTRDATAETRSEPRRAAPRAARPARRVPVPRRRGPRDLRRQGEVGAQARRLALLQGAGAEQPGPRRDGRERGAASSASSSPPRPRRCWPSRASSSSTGRASTSACATTSPTRSSRSRSTRTIPRVYFTRERHRPGRAYFGPYSNAKRVRATLEVLAKVFMFRSCTGPEPGRRSGSPCLDYYIKRCEAPCVGYVSKEEYRAQHRRRDRLPLRPLRGDRARPRDAHARGGRGRGVRAGDARAQPPAGGALAAGAPARGQRVGRHVRRGRRGASTGARPTRRSSRCATACSPTASPSTCPTRPSASVAEVAEEFMLQYYGGHMSIPALLVVQRELGERPALADALASRRGGPVELRAAERGEKRRILELAERNARLALDQERLRSERRRQSRVEALEGLQQALGLDVPPIRIECFDISNLGGTHTVASMVVFEGGAPKKSDYRRFTIRTLAEGAPDDFAAMAEVLGAALRAVGAPGRHLAARPRLRRELRLAAQRGRDRRRQGPARGRARAAARLSRPRRRGRLAGQAHRGGLPAGPPRAARARPLHARAAAAPARARRGAPLRDHPPPQPPRPRDDELAARRAARRRPGAQARAADPLRLARGGRGGLQRGAAGGAGPAGEGRARAARHLHRAG